MRMIQYPEAPVMESKRARLTGYPHARGMTESGSRSSEQRRARHEGVEGGPELRAVAILLLQEFVFRAGDDEMRSGTQMIGELLDRRRRHDSVVGSGEHQDRLA